jgi:hypothetical protein
MKNYINRVKRLEAVIGVACQTDYMVVRYGHRTPEDCLKYGWPLFRCPDGKLQSVACIYEMRGEKFVTSLKPDNDAGRTILRNLGYEEIKGRDDLPSNIENMSPEELIDQLMGRRSDKSTNKDGGRV